MSNPSSEGFQAMEIKRDINVTPLIDVMLVLFMIAVLDPAKGSGVERIGIVPDQE